MPTSALSLCNNAILLLGASTITTFTDDSDTARTCSVIYPVVRDALLRAHNWNFSIKRTSLPQHDAMPASDYQYEYVLPADCVFVEDTDIPGEEDLGLSHGSGTHGYGSWGPQRASWRIEQSQDGRRVIRTNEATVVIRYVSAADPGVWDALFIKALVADLAAHLAIPLTGKESLAKLHAAGAAQVLAQAISRNVHETGVTYAQANTSLTRVRTGVRSRIPGVTTGG